MKKIYFFVFLLISLVSSANDTASKFSLNATITGGTTVCQNSGNVTLTLTGSGGTAPYTFVYTIDGGTEISITTTGSDDSVTIDAPTNMVSSFNYSLVSVSDSTDPSPPVTVINNTVVVVNAPPVIDFTFNNNVCSGTQVAFTSSIIGSGNYSYSWDFDDGTSLSSQQNPNHAFEALGCGNSIFNVTLTVTGNGCTVTKTYPVTIKRKPDIDFTDVLFPFDPFSNCSNASSNSQYSITVGNSSTSACISSFSINWGDGSIENNISFPISHLYTELGVYNMVITAIGDNQCVSVKSYLIKNISNPLGGLNSPGSTQNLCAPTSNLQFSISNWGTNSLDTTYTINYGDGTPILVLSQLDLNESDFFNEENPSMSSNYPIPHMYDTSSCPQNSFTVTLDVENACGITPFTLGNISILTKPTANFSAPSIACVNNSIQFTNTTISGFGQNCNTNAIYTWNFGDGSPLVTTTQIPVPQNITHTYTSSGTYNVTLTAVNFCGNTTITKTICIEPPLAPQFTLNSISGCAPFDVTTTNNTVLTNQCSDTSYLWNVAYNSGNCGNNSSFTFTNGTSATSANPSFSFTGAGTYTISLTTTNGCGTVTSLTQIINVKKPPTVTIDNIPTFCSNESLSALANVDICSPDSNAITYLWTFAGGVPSTATTETPPTVSYPNTGSYSISLAVTNECGTTTATSNTFLVQTAPIVQATTISTCSGESFSLLPNNSIIGNSIPAGTTYSWTIPVVTGGITGASAGNNQNNIFGTLVNNTTIPQTATYNVTPKAGNCIGDTFTLVVTINPSGQIIQPINLVFCNDEFVMIPNFSSINTIGTTTYSWTNSNISIGIPSSGNGNVPPFTALNSGNSPISSLITVTPTFNNGTSSCVGTPKTFTITVNPNAQVNQPSDLIVCAGTATGLINFSTISSGGITTYQWTNNNPSIGLTSSGSGNISSFIPVNETNNPIIANITVTPTYTNNGISCLGTSKTFAITVNPQGQVNSVPNVVACNGDTIPSFLFTTTNNISGDTTYSWTNNEASIGIPSSGTNLIPTFTCINNGTSPIIATITVTPTYSNTINCDGLPITFTITVNPSGQVNSVSNKTVCNNSIQPAIVFGSSNTLGTTTYSWTNDTAGIGIANSGTGNIGAFTAINSGTDPIIATIVVTPIFTNNGIACQGIPESFTITINPSGQVNQVPNQILCSGTNTNPIIFSTINTGGNTIFNWTNSNPTIGLPASGTGNIASFNVNNNSENPITATITVTPSFSNGAISCLGSTENFTITVNPSPAVNFSILDQTICSGGTNALVTLNSTTSNANFTWTAIQPSGITGVITSGTNTIPAQTLVNNTNAPIIVTYIATATTNDTSACQGTTNNYTITVNPLPTISTQPTESQTICVGGNIAPLSIAYIGGDGTPTYQWFSNNIDANNGGTLISGATQSTYAPPVFTTVGNFYYYAQVTLSGTGCGVATTNTSLVEVVADPLINQQPISVQTLCEGSLATTLEVQSTGGTGSFSYQWFSSNTNNTASGTEISGATNSFFTPLTNMVGTQYYYCEISQTGAGCSVISNIAEVIVVPSPTFTTPPMSSSVCLDGLPTLLLVDFINGTGTVSYQWYSNSDNNTTTGIAIANATNETFLPPSNITGTIFYYVIVSFSEGGCTSITSQTAAITINPLPTISTQPTSSQTICVGGSIPALSVAYQGGVGTATYQWFSNTNNSNTGGTLITNANQPTYTPPAFTTVGNFYYYAVVTLSGDGCGTITSNTSLVEVVADPILNQQPLSTQTLCENSLATSLVVQPVGGTGSFSYQWFSSNTNNTASGTEISGATNSFFTPSTNVVGTQYYYCEISQTGAGCSVISNIAEVIVVPSPTIISQPESSLICQEGTPTLLSVAFNNGTGIASFQWYNNTSNSNIGGSLINGATNADYSPPSDIIGTTYYYVIITFSEGGCTSILSNTATVTINPLPTISTQPTESQTICVGGSIAPLSIGYSNGVGSPTYQWFSNINNSNIGGTLITNANQPTYTPPAFTTAGDFYYYAVVTLSGDGCGSVATNTAQVEVVADPILNQQPLSTQTLCENSLATSLVVQPVGGTGSFSYQWFSSNTNNTASGTEISGATNS
uniref:PKD domain-containing protein n=1 Tax=Flavobacterium sp. TaxID=239 RepID=UPI00404A0FDF